MNLLLDTHVLIWFFTDLEKLPRKVINHIESTSNNHFVSIASLWEMSIKHSINKIELEITLEAFYSEVKYSAIKIQPIRPTHLLSIADLPYHHRDPFDRLIIAQALTENYTIITKDKAFSSYPVGTLWD